MPAVYGIDLIEKRDRKIRMDRSIIKCWNVHYQTLEEVEEEARIKKLKAEEAEVEEDLSGDYEYEEAQEEIPGPEEAPELHKHAYNRKTGSYSGHYGKKPVEDEEAKSQIHAILNEKKNAFDSALSALQNNGAAD